jgi:hypothetical protein
MARINAVGTGYEEHDLDEVVRTLVSVSLLDLIACTLSLFPRADQFTALRPEWKPRGGEE